MMFVKYQTTARIIVILASTFILTWSPEGNSLANINNNQPTIGEPTNTFGMNNDPLFTGCGTQVTAAINPDYEQQVVELVNNERTSRGIPPLKFVDQAINAARYHSADLGQDNYFEHDSYDRIGSELVWVCSTWDRIATFYSGARAENIAAGYSSPASVMAGWMGSPGHRANILNTNYWEIGVGYFNGSGDYYHYWTQDFGKRTGVFPVIINNEAATTSDRVVSIYIYGTFTDMRLRNNNDAWSDWLPFSNTTSWQLPPQSGEHTVSVEMRYSGITKSNSDTIYLSLPSQPELGNLPDQLTFSYNLQDQHFAPSTAQLTPLNVGSEETLDWSVTKQGSWFDITPNEGITPQAITINPNIYTELEQSVYTGFITITVTSPPAINGSPHVIALELNVIDTPTYKAFLPLLTSPNH